MGATRELLKKKTSKNTSRPNQHVRLDAETLVCFYCRSQKRHEFWQWDWWDCSPMSKRSIRAIDRSKRPYLANKTSVMFYQDIARPPIFDDAPEAPATWRFNGERRINQIWHQQVPKSSALDSMVLVCRAHDEIQHDKKRRGISHKMSSAIHILNHSLFIVIG